MLVCYLLLGFTVCPDGKIPPPGQPYIVRDLDKGTDKHYNVPVQNWYGNYPQPEIRVFLKRD
jgi:hypothetical protein